METNKLMSEADIAKMQYWDERKAQLKDKPTLRDQFAMVALGRLIQRTNQPITDVDKCTSLAYEFADAMMEARSKK